MSEIHVTSPQSQGRLAYQTAVSGPHTFIFLYLFLNLLRFAFVAFIFLDVLGCCPSRVVCDDVSVFFLVSFFSYD